MLACSVQSLLGPCHRHMLSDMLCAQFRMLGLFICLLDCTLSDWISALPVLDSAFVWTFCLVLPRKPVFVHVNKSFVELHPPRLLSAFRATPKSALSHPLTCCSVTVGSTTDMIAETEGFSSTGPLVTTSFTLLPHCLRTWATCSLPMPYRSVSPIRRMWSPLRRRPS